jgi:hypothetical protein
MARLEWLMMMSELLHSCGAAGLRGIFLYRFFLLLIVYLDDLAQITIGSRQLKVYSPSCWEPELKDGINCEDGVLAMQSCGIILLFPELCIHVSRGRKAVWLAQP